jgi:hypothetical protein
MERVPVRAAHIPGITGVALTATLPPLGLIDFPKSTPYRAGHWYGDSQKASLGHLSTLFRTSPSLNTYTCPPHVMPVDVRLS